MKSKWKKVKTKEIIDFNPREKLSRGTMVKKISMDKLEVNHRDISEYEVVEYDEGVKFKNGDTLMARITPSLENGKTAQVNLLDEGEVGMGSTEFIVLREKAGISDRNFIYYLAKSPLIRQPAIKSMVGSSGRQRVQTDVLMNTEIKVPSYPEQKVIGDFFRTLDDKIRLNDEMNKNLYEQAEAIFQEWFAKFSPFKLGKEAHEEFGHIPEGWDVTEFCNMANIQAGFVFRSDDYCENGCRLTRTTNIMNGYVNNHSQIYLPFDYYYISKYRKYRFECFDTVLIMVGSNVGKIGLITERNIPSLQNQNMWRFRPQSENISSAFVHFSTKRINEKVKFCSAGSARSFYHMDLFKRAQCVCPPAEVFLEFDRLVMPLFSQISLNLAENENIGNIRDTLIPKLMTGNIRLVKAKKSEILKKDKISQLK